MTEHDREKRARAEERKRRHEDQIARDVRDLLRRLVEHVDLEPVGR